jgi:MOSC domain-containing protein YiiM
MPIDPDSPLGRLLAGPVRPGEVAWIGLRPARKAAMLEPPSARLVAGRGLEGDHYDTRRDGPRQVTLVAAEDIAAVAGFLGRAAAPEQLRRNLVTRGINLLALKDRRFRIGEALLEGSGECAPCGLMEITLGPGGYNAVRGRGGITARVIEGGAVRIGDSVARIDPDGATRAELA